MNQVMRENQRGNHGFRGSPSHHWMVVRIQATGNLEAWQGLGCMSRDASCKEEVKPSYGLKISDPNSPPLLMR